ncbi:MAG TPA: hypothetical protein VGV15_00415, partial [Terriglobales bacterium]|nr:hypothetical protein [Terriglobales bacterium]
MLTYQLRPRVIRITGGGQPTFPSNAEINFYLQPLHLFGMAAEGGRAMVQGHAASILWNANTGRLL